ncbi:S-adenosyl-L-methionine-dependent methyltransferase [Streptomyces lucensis JCM 4490]|uniref:S-adenosyl-L-methionine-dependent methyltransferase n=1 Tax=Streptomyces lucensis JCM 4490 TaxID=1306176 RepID=A0A918MNL0_9ACTN|nr:SAM-dependent methyltransferase [Streptomyces lucensis]GGW41957.1 S-adenosyl-L-methionine-dependent methyltransferase [Streptomyces lucensis JCM 4490]
MLVEATHPTRGRRAAVPGLPAGVGLTALCTARERGAENRRPDRLFEDRVAQTLTEVIDRSPRAAGRTEGPAVADRASMRDFVALRTRFFDEELRAASERCRQVVLLGSGLDSRVYRLDWARGTEVYELDRGDVLRFKHGIVARTGEPPRCACVEVGADLRGDWPGALRAAGFHPWRPTVWCAEELLPYLSRAENDRLLSGITAMSAAGSRLVVDHFDRALRGSGRLAPATEVLRAVGAHWRSTLEVPDAWLAPHGWSFGLTDPAELARRSGREVPGLLGAHAGGDGHMWLISAVR